jgi:hypothetical protein
MEKTKIVVLDIMVPEKVEENAHKVNENRHLESPEDMMDSPDMCCGDFESAFGEYLKGQLCSDSLYVGIKVRMKIGNFDPVDVRMNTEGPPSFMRMPKHYTVSIPEGLVLPELEVY